ncbi:hypothetical protein [Dendrosporobacter sp. 1207_IL3150]|uniref:hypothetical protein n=1 Tax=Dendrosporobacter sp. 1207_IL3150 TaxID=3084054 RepID=UPI002FD9CD37
MVVIESRNQGKYWELAIILGMDELRQINPEYTDTQLSIDKDKFYDIESSLGVGTIRQELPKAFQIPDEVEWKLVDEFGKEIPEMKIGD